jgi:hypothetical protein
MFVDQATRPPDAMTKLRDAITTAQRDVLSDLHRRDRQERQDGIREAMSLKALSPEVAELLYAGQ